MENTQTFDETGFLIARKAVKAGAVMLWLLAGLAALQLGLMFFNVNLVDTPPGEEIYLQVTLGLYIAFAAVLGFFGWFMKSRVALILGMIFFVLNWAEFVFALMDGQFTNPGWINLIGPFFLGRGIWKAFIYHKMLPHRPREVDAEVFA